jgi:hypothetical protein
MNRQQAGIPRLISNNFVHERISNRQQSYPRHQQILGIEKEENTNKIEFLIRQAGMTCPIAIC